VSATQKIINTLKAENADRQTTVQQTGTATETDRHATIETNRKIWLLEQTTGSHGTF
jgi:hypothetical protein